MRRPVIWLTLSVIISGVLFIQSNNSDGNEIISGLPSFPGAEGFGSTTPGGRGGRIIEVTNLMASGPGSFAEACESSGPRIVIFRVGGMIKTTSIITIKNPFITIAGQTAPGDGICIGGGGYLSITTHDVIVRCLRVRVGDNPTGPKGDNRDGIGIANESVPPFNIILDHCSVSWAIDENIQLWYPCHDISIQWCITSEALDSSLHQEGPHSKGMIIGPGAERISIHHNLFAHNVERNPLISVDTETEVINNVIYNWKSRGLHLGNCYPEHSEKSNVIGNYFKKGPDTEDMSILISYCWKHSKVYASGNIGEGRPNDFGDEWSLIVNEVDPGIKASGSVIESKISIAQPVNEAYESVLSGAGAITPIRDETDTRIILDVRKGTGKIIDSQSEIGAWPDYQSGTPPADSDHDGMPDKWEIKHGLDKNNSSDGNLKNLSALGYTNIEVYINSLMESSIRVQ